MSAISERLQSRVVGRRAALRGGVLASAGLVGGSLVACSGSNGNNTTASVVATPRSTAAARTGGPSANAVGTTPAVAAPSFAGLSGQKLLDAVPVRIARDFEYKDVTPGGTFTWIPASDPIMLDPHLSNSSSVGAATGPMYSRLLRLKSNAEMDPFRPEIVGDLATSWEQADPTTLLLHLRPNVKFHNVAPTNGRALKTDDILFSLKRVSSDQGSPFRSFFSQIAAFEAPDAQTIKITTKQPTAQLLQVLAGFFSAILPPELVGSGDGAKQKSAGTGAFLLDHWTEKVEVVWKKNPDYYGVDPAGNKLPYLDGLRFQVVPDAAQRLAAFRAGEVDQAYGGTTTSNVDQVVQSIPDVRLLGARPWYTNFGIAVRNDKAPFSDVRVRRALNMAVNRQGINDTLFAGAGFNGMFFPWSFIFDKQPGLADLGPWFQYNPQQAKQLLSAAGIADGSLSFNVPFNEYGAIQPTLEIIQQGWKKDLNVNMAFTKMDYAQYFDIYKGKKYDAAALANFGLLFPDLDSFVEEWPTNSVSNSAGTSDSNLDALIAKQQIQLDTAERTKTAKDIYAQLADQMYTVWMPVPKEIWGYRPAVMNWRDSGWFTSFYYSYQFEAVWKKKA